MITWYPDKTFLMDGKYLKKGACLEKDKENLPKDLANGSQVIVMDESYVLMFDEEGSKWDPFE